MDASQKLEELKKSVERDREDVVLTIELGSQLLDDVRRNVYSDKVNEALLAFLQRPSVRPYLLMSYAFRVRPDLPGAAEVARTLAMYDGVQESLNAAIVTTNRESTHPGPVDRAVLETGSFAPIAYQLSLSGVLELPHGYPVFSALANICRELSPTLPGPQTAQVALTLSVGWNGTIPELFTTAQAILS